MKNNMVVVRKIQTVLQKGVVQMPLSLLKKVAQSCRRRGLLQPSAPVPKLAACLLAGAGKIKNALDGLKFC